MNEGEVSDSIKLENIEEEKEYVQKVEITNRQVTDKPLSWTDEVEAEEYNNQPTSEEIKQYQEDLENA